MLGILSGGGYMSTPTLRRQFTVRDYTRMRETGILTEDDRVELLDGEIYQISPLGSLHIAIVNRLNKLLMRQVGDDAILSIQNSVQSPLRLSSCFNRIYTNFCRLISPVRRN